MGKRPASKQLTKDDPDAIDEHEEDEEEESREADEATLKQRKIVKIKYKAPAADAAPMTLNLGNILPTSTESKSAMEQVMTSETWECPDCLLANAMDKAKCVACEAPRPAGVGAPASAPAAAAPAAAQDTWECGDCLLENKGDLQKCAACEAPRPGSSAPADSSSSAETEPEFTFGAVAAADSSSSSSSGAADSAPFSFGANVEFPTFSFDTNNNNSSSTDSSSSTSTFGQGNSGSFSFGDIAASGGDSGFAFGSTESEEQGADSAQQDDAEVTMDEPLTKNEAFKDATAEPSGEEHDQIVHKAMCKLFQLKPAADDTQKKNEWKECGVGELHINNVPVDKDGKSILGARLILRVEKTHRLVLNAPLFKGMKFTRQDDKYICLVSKDLQGAIATFLIKFKSKGDCSEALNGLQRCIDNISS